MNRIRLKNEIKLFLNSCLLIDASKINDDDSLFLGNRIDADFIIALILHIETAFDVRIPDDMLDVNNFDSVEKCATMVLKFSE